MSEDKDDKWEMPKPVFQSSTGALPKSLEDTIHESTFPSAETVKINNKKTVEMDADTLEIGEDTLEIGEDEDILSLHGSSPVKNSEDAEDFDGDTTLAMESDAEPEPESEPDTAPEPAPSEEPATAAAAEDQPVVVAAKQPEAKKNGAGSFLFVFVGLALLAGLIVVAVYYFYRR